MKARAVLISIGLFAASMTSTVAHADQEKREQAFCDALARFRSGVTTLESIGPNSTMAELRAASDRVAMDADDVEKAAHRIKSPTAKQFTDSARQLRAEIRALAPNITVDQAKSRIHNDVQNVQRSGQRLATKSGCPEAAPASRPQQGTPPLSG